MSAIIMHAVTGKLKIDDSKPSKRYCHADKLPVRFTCVVSSIPAIATRLHSILAQIQPLIVFIAD